MKYQQNLWREFEKGRNLTHLLDRSPYTNFTNYSNEGLFDIYQEYVSQIQGDHC